MKDQVTSRVTVRCLPLYYRYLRMLYDTRRNKVPPTELSEAIQVDSATTHHDFSYFGELGKRGYGYDVENSTNFFAKILNEDGLINAALVRVDSLGSALLKYKFHQSDSIHVSYAPDVNEDIVGCIADGAPVYPMEDMAEQTHVQQIGAAILIIPARKAQEVTNKFAEAEIKGTLNSTAARLIVLPEVLIQNADSANGLQTLIYFLHHDDELIDEEE